MKVRVASFLIRLLALTWRFRVEGHLPQAPSILAFWHDEMLPVWRYFANNTNHNTAGLTSLSKDGDILARILEDWKYQVVRGSSSNGGKEALEQLQCLATQALTLITPDGPRGPRHVFKAGAVIAAQRSGATLYLCRAFYRGKRFERSWDNFLLPYPFVQITLVFSEPLRFSSRATNDDIDAEITFCEMLLNTGL